MLEGLPPNDASRLLRLACDEATARRATDAIVDLLDPADTAAAAFEEETSPARPKAWILEIYLSPRVADETVRSLLRPVIGDELAAALQSEAIVKRDWVEASLAGLAPVRAGRFLIHGRHGRTRVRANDVALEIEAALAFGTGHHGTTRGCLLALDRVLRRRRPRRVLDVGTGTGVLAMAAAKALKVRIASGDVDPVAVASARANAQANGVGPLVHPVVAAGLRHRALRADAPYDLIFANILARPLRALAPAIAAAAVSGADLILSGLLPADVPGILSAYGPQGFRLAARTEIESWATLMMVKR